MKVKGKIIASIVIFISAILLLGTAPAIAGEKLPAPSVTLKTNKSGNPQLTWKKISGATGYKVYRKYGDGEKFKLIKTTTKLKYSDSKIAGILEGTDDTAEYKVYAYTKNEKGKAVLGKASDVKEWTIAPAEPVKSIDKSKNSPTVYVSNSGKYHSKSNCSGMKYYTVMTLDEAIEAGYDACKKCYK